MLAPMLVPERTTCLANAEPAKSRGMARTNLSVRTANAKERSTMSREVVVLLFAIRYSHFFIRYANAFAPPTMSSSSIVICVCLARLYFRVSAVIISAAASVAAFIATIRPICSLTVASVKH